MTKHPPTSEQEAILSAVTSTTDNLMVEARAGCGKTSTLVLIAEALPRKAIHCLAFNRSIAHEMQERLPPNCTSTTINSLGYNAWRDKHPGTRFKIKDSKLYDLLSDELQTLEGTEQKFAYENFKALLSVLKESKTRGYLPAPHEKKSLLSREEFFSSTEAILDPILHDLVDMILRQSLDAAGAGTLDFADQILLPALFGGIWPRPQVLLVDEAQDLSPLDHVIISALIGKRRLIAVGDPYQAIYAFRGADEESMETLRQRFDMKTFYLTLTFRCSEAVVNAAKWRASDLRARPSAPEGLVRSPGLWLGPELIPDGAFILCRNNAPLFQMALRMLSQGLYPELKNNNILDTMIKELQRLGDPATPRATLLEAISKWVKRKKKSSRAWRTADDTAEAMRLFARQAPNLRGALEAAETIRNTRGRTFLMTGHRSKGLEAPHVLILDAHLCTADGQDPNILYVMQTRAKETLTYIRTDSWEHHEEEEEAQ